MQQHQQRLHQCAELLQRTRLVLSRQLDRVDRSSERLTSAVRQRLEREQSRLRLVEQGVTLADPANILRRGFSITRVDGRAVTSPADVPAGARIVTQLAGGVVTSVAEGE
jgi:exodeoxyribonuclease VII large subunit